MGPIPVGNPPNEPQPAPHFYHNMPHKELFTPCNNVGTPTAMRGRILLRARWLWIEMSENGRLATPTPCVRLRRNAPWEPSCTLPSQPMKMSLKAIVNGGARL